MSATVTAIVGVGLVSAYMSKESAKDASEASAEGTELSVAGQTAALDYLKEVEHIPRQYRESAMSMLAAEFGLPAAEEFQRQVDPGAAPATVSGSQGQGSNPTAGSPGGSVLPNNDGFNNPGDRGRAGYNARGDYGYNVQRDTGEGGTYEEWVSIPEPRTDGTAQDTGPGAPFLSDQRQQGNTKLVNDTGLTGFDGVSSGQPTGGGGDPFAQMAHLAQEQATTGVSSGQPTTGQAPMSITDRAMASPLYQSLMDTINASRVDLTGDSIRAEGEDAILRNQSMTGGFRSGNTQSNLARFNMGLEERLVGARNEQDRRITADKSNALLTAYNQQISGLQGFANLPSNANAIADLQTGIGDTQGQGAIARGQIAQAGDQAIGDAITGGVGNYLDYRATI